VQWDHYYGNPADFQVNNSGASAINVNLSNVVFDNPTGTMQNYTTVSLADSVDAATAYLIKWTVNSSTLPSGLRSFAQKFVNITNASGAVSIDSISWNWQDSELGGYDENGFELWKYNASGWTILNNTPDAAGNTLSLTNMNPASEYGILQSNLTQCPLITASGTYVQNQSYSGSPNDASEVAAGAKACVKIAASNVVYDCNGYAIANGTVATTYGILVNASASNVTVKNCPYVYNYSFGAYVHASQNVSLTNTTAFNNTLVGFYLNASSNCTLSNSTAYGNPNGLYLISSNNNTLSNNTAHDNTEGLITVSSSNNTLAHNHAFNNTDGFYFVATYNNTVDNNAAHDNTVDFYLAASDENNAFNNNTAFNSTYGFAVVSSSNNAFTNNTVYNDANGFYLVSGAENNSLANNTAFSNTYGFALLSVSNVLVNNTGYGNVDAFFLGSTATNNTLENNTAYNNSDGFALSSSSGNNFTSNNAFNNTYGFAFTSSSNNTLSFNTVFNNSNDGLLIVSSSNNSFTGNMIYRNTFGFAFTSSSDNNLLVNNTAFDNSRSGFYLLSSNFNNFTNNTAYSNAQHGFFIQQSNYSSFTDNTAYSNVFDGFQLLFDSTNNVLVNNTAFNNTQNGFWLDVRANYNNLTNNTVYNNTNSGFSLSDLSNQNNLDNNTAYGNQYGISIVPGFNLNLGAHDNSMNLNHVYNNAQHNLFFSNSTGNVFANGTLSRSNYGDGYYDAYSEENASNYLLNATFNKSSVAFQNAFSNLFVQWYLDVRALDKAANPVAGAEIRVFNATNPGTPMCDLITQFNVDPNLNGRIGWRVVTEYVQNGSASFPNECNGTAQANLSCYTNHTIKGMSDNPFKPVYVNESMLVNFTLGQWAYYHGFDNAAIALRENVTNESLVEMSSSQGNVYGADEDSAVNWTAMQALGYNRNGAQNTSSFNESDKALNLTGAAESIQALYDANNDGVADRTATFVVFGRTISNVPVINTTNTSSFVTGILWDTSGNAYYSNATRPPLVFVTNINHSQAGKYGTYDYELRLPSPLVNYTTGGVSNYARIYWEKT